MPRLRFCRSGVLPLCRLRGKKNAPRLYSRESVERVLEEARPNAPRLRAGAQSGVSLPRPQWRACSGCAAVASKTADHRTWGSGNLVTLPGAAAAARGFGRPGRGGRTRRQPLDGRRRLKLGHWAGGRHRRHGGIAGVAGMGHARWRIRWAGAVPLPSSRPADSGASARRPGPKTPRPVPDAHNSRPRSCRSSGAGTRSSQGPGSSLGGHNRPRSPRPTDPPARRPSPRCNRGSRAAIRQAGPSEAGDNSRGDNPGRPSHVNGQYSYCFWSHVIVFGRRAAADHPKSDVKPWPSAWSLPVVPQAAGGRGRESNAERLPEQGRRAVGR